MVSANIAVTGLIWELSYSKNTVATSKLITSVKLENNRGPTIPKATSLSLSINLINFSFLT